jgi:YVTN family beta-propeller protein
MRPFLAFALVPCLQLVAQEPTPAAPATPAPPTAKEPASDVFKVLNTFPVGGEGSWDYISIDSAARRLYVSHGTHVVVLDADTGKQVGEIKDTAGVHGIAIAADLGKGFTSNGRANTTTVFDLKTLEPIKTVPTGKNPDALAYDPASKCVFFGDGRSGDVTQLDAEKLEVTATIPIGGKPEAVVVDGKGKVYVNVEDKSEIVEIDAAKHAVTRRFSVAPGEEPSGLAIDAEQHHLFSVCHNEMMVVIDIESGKVLATPAIGKSVDGAAFDAEGGYALSSNGDGTLTVVAARGEKPFTVVQNLATAPHARTITFDPKTHRAYLPTAEFEATPQDASSGGRPRRPAMKPGSFKVVVVGR